MTRVKQLPSITSRYLQRLYSTAASALAVPVLALVTVGVAYAQAPDLEAVGTRLLRGVEAGELSPAQAAEMMATLARVRFGERLHEHDVEAVEVRPPAAIDRLRGLEIRSRALPDQASNAKDSTLVQGFAGLGVDRRSFDSLSRALDDAGVTAEQREPALGGMLRMIHSALGDAEPSARDARTFAFLENEVGLSNEQVELIHRLAVRSAKIVQGSRPDRRQRGLLEQRGASPAPDRQREKPDAASDPWTQAIGQVDEAVRGRAPVAETQRTEAALRQMELRGIPMSVAEYRRRMQRAVKSGKLAAADARHAIDDYRANLEERGIPPIDHESMRAAVDEAVERGELKKELARAKYRAALERAAAAVAKRDAAAQDRKRK